MSEINYEKSGFICAAWRKRLEGPMHARRTLVNRCDLPDGHEGKHVDHVLLVSWPDKESAEECRPRNDLNSPEPLVPVMERDVLLSECLSKFDIPRSEIGRWSLRMSMLVALRCYDKRLREEAAVLYTMDFDSYEMALEAASERLLGKDTQ